MNISKVVLFHSASQPEKGLKNTYLLNHISYQISQHIRGGGVKMGPAY